MKAVLKSLSVCCHVKQLLVYRCLNKESYWPAGLSLITMDWVLTLPEVFLCYSFFPAFWCFVFFVFFLLNYSIKLTRNLWVWPWLFTTDLSETASPESQIFSMSLFPPLLGVGPLHFTQPILILTSDFTRLTARVTMISAKPGMLLEHIQHVVGLPLELCWLWQYKNGCAGAEWHLLGSDATHRSAVRSRSMEVKTAGACCLDTGTTYLLFFICSLVPWVIDQSANVITKRVVIVHV